MKDQTVFDSDACFDLPHSAPLRKSYIVASSYRSGSTHLCLSLWQTGLLGAPAEFLNSVTLLPNLMNRFKATSHADYVTKLLARRTSTFPKLSRGLSQTASLVVTPDIHLHR
jgi:LPS sulfotransferase NodH